MYRTFQQAGSATIVAANVNRLTDLDFFIPMESRARQMLARFFSTGEIG